MYKSFFAKKAQNAIRDHKITVNNLKSRKMPGEPHHAAKHKRALKIKDNDATFSAPLRKISRQKYI